MNDHPRLSMLDHALAYAARGWPVFPCNQNNKAPLVPGAEKDAEGNKVPETGGLYHATCDEAQIRTWWRTRPQAMIGVRCGEAIGAFVLDLDAHSDPETGEIITAEAIRADIEALLGVALPETLTSKTPRGGWHMLFRMPEGEAIGNGRGVLKKIGCVDVRGGTFGGDNSGYIILAPSMRSGPKAVDEGCDGVAYRWIDPDCPIADPPPRLIDALLERGDFAPAPVAVAPKPRRMNAADFGSAVEATRRKYAEAALDRACGEIASAPKGQRGKTIMEKSPVIGRMVAAGYLDLNECIAAFQHAGAMAGLTPANREMGPHGQIVRFLTQDARKEPFDFSEIGTRAGRGSDRPPLPEDDGRGDHGRDAEAVGRNRSDKRNADLSHDHASSDSLSAAVAPPPEDDGSGEGVPSGARGEKVDPAVVEFCAGLDASDTDNAVRMIRHFGEDLVVQAQEGTAGGDWGCWSGRHWDFPNGMTRATLLAQRVGDRIGLESAYLFYSQAEETAITEGQIFFAEKNEDLNEHERMARDAAKDAMKALRRRKDRRNSHGVTSKNAGRIKSMMDMAAPKLRRPVDAFNPDRHAVACLTHTLRFRRIRDADCDAEGNPRFAGEIVADARHRREDLITALVPVEWRGGDAPAAKWLKFVEWALPDADKRRTVQQFAALGMLATPVQYVMLHYGTGANGKSVFLEVLSRLLGPSIAVGLPQESIMGVGERAAGGASPDIARLWGKRMLRVNELKPGAPLQSELVKRLTGGESFPVRTLFKGYFEFQNVASVHMSANGKPVIDGSDYGIVRRVLMVHWDQTVPEAERRDFEEMVVDLLTEGPGILAWLAEGARDFMASGMQIAGAIQKDTADYARDMDPFGRFTEACLQEEPQARVQGKEMASAYNAWAAANGERDKDARQVGKGVRKALEKRAGFDSSQRIREIGGVTQYLDLKLVNVPEPERRERPASPREEF